VYIDESSVNVEKEADAVIECPHDDQPHWCVWFYLLTGYNKCVLTDDLACINAC